MLFIFGGLSLLAAVVAAILGFANKGDQIFVPVLSVAIGLFLGGLILLALAHALRYLRLIVNSLASMRARPLGAEIDN
jgi:hypothetical protein